MSIQVLRERFARASRFDDFCCQLSEVEAALAEVAALESQLAEAKAELWDWMNERGPRLAAEVENVRIAELKARAEVSERREKEADRLYSQCAALLDGVEAERNAALAKAEEFEARLAEANERAEANYHRMPRRGELGAAIQRAEQAESQLAEARHEVGLAHTELDSTRLRLTQLEAQLADAGAENREGEK